MLYLHYIFILKIWVHDKVNVQDSESRCQNVCILFGALRLKHTLSDVLAPTGG